MLQVCENGGKRLENDSISRLVLTLGIWIIGAHLLAVVWSCLTDNSPEKPETSTVIIPSHQNISTHQIAAMLLNASVDANENRVACKMSVPTLLTISLLTAHLLIPIVVIFSQISPSVQAVSLALNSLSISSVRPILMLYAIAKKCVKGSQTQTERVFGPNLPQLDFGDHYVDVKEDWRDFTSSPTETEV